MEKFHSEAAKGNLDSVRKMLDSGTDVNMKDSNNQQTALMCAVREAQLEVVRELLLRGAEANSKDSHGQTALMFAVGKRIPLMPEDLNRDLSIEWHRRYEDRILEIVQELLNHGADPNNQDESGNTALHIAAETVRKDPVSKFYIQTIERLIKHGAKAKIKNKHGAKAVYSLGTRGEAGAIRKVTEMLLAAEADEAMSIVGGDNDEEE